MSPPRATRERLPWRKLAQSALLVTGLVAAGLTLRTLSAGLDAAALDSVIVGQGARGQAIFVALAATSVAAGLPRQAASFAAGYAFGLWPGIPLAMAALVTACAANFFWARLAARDWTRRHVLTRLGGRLARLDAFLAARPFSATLIVRLLPVGSNLAFNLLAGVSAVPALPFMAGSALGYVPQTVVFALLGSGVGVADWVRIGIGAALFAASIGLGAVLIRRNRVPSGNAGEAQ